MVQRKVAHKLGIQADQVKYNKLFGSLKSSSLQHQDTKNRGADMKKKMKKSRSIKHPDMECFSTTSLESQVPQPRKPPPSAATCLHKSLVKTSESTPNYMKSTSSSDARKEQSQMSCRNLLPLFDNKNTSRRNSNSSDSAANCVQKVTRTLARPSSLKLVRTLTKTTSFKPARASANKCSPLALSENLNVQKATCSSTLKDSKFPAHLILDPGGSEAEGTSAMKVCPYAYCSLNGHHHPPLPPLKSFLSARRRMLKTLNIKLRCLSTRQSKADKEAIEETEKWKVNFDDNSSSEEASNPSIINPVIQQEHDDFFIQIYSREGEIVADTSVTGKSQEDYLLPSTASPDYHVRGSQDTEGPLAKFTLSEIGSHDNSGENSDCISTEMETSEGSLEEHRESEEVAAEESGDEEAITGSIPVEDPESGHSDLDWGEGKYSTSYLDDEASNPLKTSLDYDLAGDSVEYNSFIIYDESSSKSDGTVNSSCQEIQAGELQAKSSDEESMSSDADSHQDFKIDENVQGPGNQNYDQFELITVDENNDEIKQSKFVESTFDISANPLRSPAMEPCADLDAKTKEDNDTAKVNPEVEDASVQTEIDAFTDYCENQFEQDDDTVEQTYHLGSQDISAECSIKECSQTDVNFYQSDAHLAINCINVQASRGNAPPKENDSESETNRFKINSGVAVMEKEQVEPFPANITIEIIIRLQDSSEVVNMKCGKDAEENHIDANQTRADIDFPAETRENTSDEEFIGGSSKNLSSLEEHKDANFISCEFTDTGDQLQSPTTELSLFDHAEQDSLNIEMEDTSCLQQEICPTSESTSELQIRDAHMDMEDNSDEELGKTCKKLNWTNKRKVSTEEQEGQREFNPRAPNFLPLEPDKEAEKVDLRHQMIDDRRNSEEWMLDHALQQALTKLAPARKKKVALLVEAFEKVMPIPNWDAQMRHASAGFAKSPRPIQACS